MALTNFLDQTCTIYSKSLTTTAGEQTQSFNAVYTNIPCYYYKDEDKEVDVTGIARETKTGRQRVFLEPSRTSVREGMEIVITDPILGNIGRFYIEMVKIQRMLSYDDSIYLIVRLLD